MKNPVLKYESRGPEGNIFWILGQVRRLLQEQNRITAYNELWERVQSADSYNDALQLIGEEVTLIDTAK
jgi:hypothetical protein